MQRKNPVTRQVLAWACYDWANSAFATTVVAGFFPIFFKEFWNVGADVTVSSFRLGVANSVASLLVLLMAPVLGAIADQGRFKKYFLTLFAGFGILGTATLSFPGPGEWSLAIILFVLAGVGFAAANIFYDALMADVAEPKDFDWVSGFGFALGYLGGGLLFASCIILTVWPDAFGFQDSEQAVRFSFLLTALWWAIFTIPLLRYVVERPLSSPVSFRTAVERGLGQLRTTFHKIRRYRQVWTFLIAYWLYIDGVDTLIRMAVDYGLALGFQAQGLIVALLITQFVGFPASIAFGVLGNRFGPKVGILIGLAVYIGITIWSYRLQHAWEFYALAATIGLVQGGVQALSRSLYARLIPREASAEFFGFYNLLGKSAAVIGPVLMGWLAVVTGSTRVSVLGLLVLFILGGFVLLFVNSKPRETEVA